jgi:GDP-L-fucose synthase
VLAKRGVGSVVAARSRDFDLTTREGASRMFDVLQPDVVIHAAGVGGGIAAHRAHPGLHFTANTLIAIHVIDEARRRAIEKLVYIGSADSYPPCVTVPTPETELWRGPLEPSSAAYGLAKKLPITMLEAYRAEYNLRSAAVILTNVYGPGASFDRELSHVVPALIRRFDEAATVKAPEVVCWGTGRATRDLLYVDDAAEGIVRAAERLDEPSPVNVASGTEVSINELAVTIATLCGFQGRVRWDVTRPDGHPRRALDISRARTLLGFEPRVKLDEGLSRTLHCWRTERRFHG